MKYLQTFKVIGSGGFPFDMLRYDKCYPASSDDSAQLDDPRHYKMSDKPRTIELMRYVMVRHNVPTAEKWKSFGWKLIEETVNTMEI
jgi:hypothetical protein